MARERWIVRVFDGRAAVHAGPYSDKGRAEVRANTLAARARRRGMNVSCTVRPLLGGAQRIDEVLDELGVLSKVHHASSFGGKSEAAGDPVDRDVAEARRRRDDRRERLRRGEWPWW